MKVHLLASFNAETSNPWRGDCCENNQHKIVRRMMATMIVRQRDRAMGDLYYKSEYLSICWMTAPSAIQDGSSTHICSQEYISTGDM